MAVVAHGWPGDGHPTNGFMWAAVTKLQEIGASAVIRPASTKAGFTGLLKELAAGYSVTEFHYFSHSGAVDGPIMEGGGQFTPAEVDQFPQLHWAPAAAAYFYGCNSGHGWFAKAFAARQNVGVWGAAGFTMFSKKQDEFYPFDADPDNPPCYQACFPGLLEIVRDKYGRLPRTVGERWLLGLLTYGECQAARDKHLPPKPMILTKPGLVVNYFGRPMYLPGR